MGKEGKPNNWYSPCMAVVSKTECPCQALLAVGSGFTGLRQALFPLYMHENV